MSDILIVDDEAIITMQLEERLTAMGYSVVGMAASGEEAVAKAKTARPDLILMDIVMPGKINGIDAAKIITEELDIPVVFVTSYADDTIIEKAKHVRPYGYIVKPFDELGLKAAIEVALFRKEMERDEASRITSGPVHGSKASDPAQASEPDAAYFDLPEIKTVLLEDIFNDILLFLYTEQTVKEPVFKFALEEAMKKGGRNLFAYFRSTVQKYFLSEIQKEQLFTVRLKKNEIYKFLQVLEKCIGSREINRTGQDIHILLDFSETDEFEDIVAVKNFVIAKKAGGVPVSGIIAMNIGSLDHNRITVLAENIPKIIVSTGKETTLSFAHNTFPADSVSSVSQSIIDEVVKKSLEPVVLSMLNKPISGYDIVHEIHNRYNVLIPQARVYTLLYDLENNGFLEIRISGKSKLYCPTDKGRVFFTQKLNEYKLVFQHILGGGSVTEPGK
ncbi:MAG TPA: response regulator [Methanoregulaceae archaeon]|nr:response regulator [Methanoregulaceae archaeon]